MASNWRWNVPELGAVGTRWDWIARYLPGESAYEYLCKARNSNTTWNPMTPIVSEDGVLTFLFTIIPADGPFPGSQKVEPDVTGA